jgi:hypothetical protein
VYRRAWEDPVNWSMHGMRFEDLVAQRLPDQLFSVLLLACYAAGWAALLLLILNRQAELSGRARKAVKAALTAGLAVNAAGLMTFAAYGALTASFLCFLVIGSARWKRLK